MKLDVSAPGPLMRFTDGLVIRGTDCPRGILARGHWRPADVLPFDGTNAVCACHPDTAVVA